MTPLTAAELDEIEARAMDWDFDSPANPGKHPQIDRLVNAITRWQESPAPVSSTKER